jgi:hypothetical protein
MWYLSNKWQFKVKALPLYLQAGHKVITSIVQQCRWRYASPWKWPADIKHWRLATQRRLLPLHNLLTTSKHPHNCPFQSVLKHLDASFRQSKPLSQLQPVTVLFSGSGSGSSSSSWALCVRISTRRSPVLSWSWQCSHCNTSTASYLRIWALGLKHWGWEQMA